MRTAVLDADFGLRNLDLLLGLENRIVYTAQEVLAGNCRLEQAMVKHKLQPNLALLPAGNPRMLEWLKPEDMQKIVGLIQPHFDVVLIDAPAGIEDGFKNAAAAAATTAEGEDTELPGAEEFEASEFAVKPLR